MMIMMVAMTKTDVSRRVVLYYSSVLKLKPYSAVPATRGEALEAQAEVKH